MKKIITVAICSLMMYCSFGQTITVQEYINTYKDIAIAEMKRSGIPASITLAQGLLETESGNSDLVKRSNNHFGIKCKSNWTGESVTHTDDAPNECFRKYRNAEDSYRDHSDFLRNNGRYASLFQLEPTDYKGWAYGLKKAGYATNPKYPMILIKNIETNNLQQFDSPEAAGESVVISPVVVDSNNVEKKITISPSIIVEDADTKTETNSASKKGKSLFNGLKAVLALKGTSLLAVATRNDIALAKLLEYNDLKQDGLVAEDQWIYLEKKPKQGNRDYYIALQKESLYEISQNNAVQLQYLMQYNNLPENAVVAKGTKINLRPGLAIGQTIVIKNDVAAKIHEVQPKEGLYAIARKYNVSVQQLREWNRLEADELTIGQKLIISK
ncbi:glucosaminidase domain-containing protein [Ferruginibacter sp. HRS2-29]|uniref:glucosaminidase domain-containing protein n=1 Tax=Ferruginibacter sp. HRS2-29 TaxID=2487334 RepID=UPI0020CC57C0|nr:glucosaminidase domain-containing protein [Ferruginibacter sp. HRS2-29]MCP9750257.1 LysM peptidoglycan-binding domain-containing protein [Ferruginibacter sp. HRS2-29]